MPLNVLVMWDARAEGESDAVDLLPLPPIAGEVAFQDVDFRFNESGLGSEEY